MANLWRLLPAAALAILAICAPAGASVSHYVEPGETLWSIAAANGLTAGELAAANGLSSEAHVIAGSTLAVPDGGDAGTAAGAAAPPALGSYVVRDGDTLTNIAARCGVSVAAVAAMNGLDPAGALQSGTVLKLPTGATLEATAPAPAGRVVPNAAPYPTSERLSLATIGEIAAASGVPASLAEAIAWQESGFNNSMVSDANARGVMQLLPGTWSWVSANLATTPLDASSAIDNVKAGALYLGQLLRDTGGDPARAVAAYYQGLDSVRRVGMLPATRRYVDDVLALRARFGGP
jgi:soluble lytic murein transglycosylase-like protein